VDEYLPGRTRLAVYLPQDYDGGMLAAMLNLATSIGRESGLGNGFPALLEVRFGAPGQVAAHEIVFARQPEAAVKPLPEGAASLALQNLPNGYSRLTITAADAAGFAKASGALGRRGLVATMPPYEITLTSPLPVQPPLTGNAFVDGKGEFTLMDVGTVDDIVIAGAFHQDYMLTLPRPANFRLGDGSYIDVHFRHSKILDPKKSALTVYLNEIPIRGVALTAENAQNGILRIPIPKDQLQMPLWQVRFGCYHDLGIIDCSKRYDEVAWTVIEKETTVKLNPGSSAYTPVWENFPNDFYVSRDGTIHLSLLMLGARDAQELTGALRLAYYIGINNHGRLAWQVADSATFDLTNFDGNLLSIGPNSAEGWGRLADTLPVSPEEKGWRVDKRLQILPDALSGFDIYEIGSLGNGQPHYAFMYTEVGRFLQTSAITMSTPASPAPGITQGSRLIGTLSGNVALVNEHFEVKANTIADQPSAMQRGLSLMDSLRSYFGGIDTAKAYFAAMAAILLLTLLIMTYVWYKGRRGI
jgi:hypothetical protein